MTYSPPHNETSAHRAKRAKSKPNDGGPSFPSPAHQGQFFECMSLRDWFAGKALPAIIDREGLYYPGETAAIAYKHADAMLKAREGK